MLLNEIVMEVGMTKRAVKYYEEKGLLSVKKDSNGYRNYSVQDVETLKKISVYRKLGIGIKDIQSLLKSDDKGILLRVYIVKNAGKSFTGIRTGSLETVHRGWQRRESERAAGLSDG